MNWIMIVIIGVVAVLGLGWQGRLITKDEENYDIPNRVIPAFFAGLTIFLGVTIWSIIVLLDENKSITWAEALWLDCKALIFGVTLCLKSYLGPIVVAITLSFVTYHFFEYGELKSVPVIQSIVNWAFSKTPDWVGVAYLVFVNIYALGSSGFDAWYE